jgi:Asp-tRNA(Asn)/Glu-tRNA(Gln) amidotransferase A subunit family amidase
MARYELTEFEWNVVQPLLPNKPRGVADEELGLALASRDRLRSDFLSRYLREASVAFLPVLPIRMPQVREVDPVSAHFNPRALYALGRFTRFVNFLGLPVGLQTVGRSGSEALLLEIGSRLQANSDWISRVPRAIAGDIGAEAPSPS